MCAGVVVGPIEILTADRAVSWDKPMLSGTLVRSFFREEHADPAEMQNPRPSEIRTTISAGKGGKPAHTIYGE